MTSYDSIKALNWSSLKHIARSPLEYRHRIGHPEPRKKDYVIGLAFHCRVLEPDQFKSRYGVYGGKRDKRCKDYIKWIDENPGVEALKQHEHDLVCAMAESVRSHKIASRLLDGCRKEEPLVWHDPTTGMQCKGRLDGVRPECIVDLKSTRRVGPSWFAHDAARLMYHGQLAWYQTGAVETGKVDGHEMPHIIAAEKNPPHDVAVYCFKPEDLEAGRRLCLSLMRRLEECIAADWWPGCAPDLQYLDLPQWVAGADLDTDEQGGF